MTSTPSRPVSRTVLFLQGPPSPFWPELADALEARGAGVRRVELCLADQLFWRRGGAVRYRGRLRDWRFWLTEFVRREGVTDILYFNDRPPYHRIAQAVARREGARAWAVEFGYLRPDWLTLERDGSGAWSHFPVDPQALRRDLPRPDMTALYPHPFWREAVAEVTFNLLMTAGRPLFPFYADDKYYWPVLDYLAWLPKLARGRAAARAAKAEEGRLIEGGVPFNLFALQMQSDYQLRHSAPFRRQADMIRHVITSFAAHAPEDRHLLIKQHPLDNGWENWPRLAREAAAQAGVAGRVSVIDGGHLGRLIEASDGVVVANSTVGLHALRAARPVIALGAAVYDMPGVTHQGGLDTFWNTPEAPRPEAVDALVAELADRIQVKGSVYRPEGRKVAVAAIAARLLDDRETPPGSSGRAARLRLLSARRSSIMSSQLKREFFNLKSVQLVTR